MLFYSENIELGGIKVRFGPEGYLAYLLPAILIVCGLLLWLTPGQRYFYAIVGTLTALYSLIGLNLGGFFIGMFLGVVGGALAFAWTPATSAASGVQTGDDADPEGAAQDEPAGGTDEVLPWEQPGPLTDTAAAGGRAAGRHRSPLGERPGVYRGGAYGSGDAEPSASQDEKPTDGTDPLPRRSPRLTVAIGIPLLITAAIALGVLRTPGVAMAEPCQPQPTTSASTSTTATTEPSRLPVSRAARWGRWSTA
jgi:hypothetical protein